jgi:hypothetical protein
MTTGIAGGFINYKKNELKPWQNKRWCIPPEGTGEFVAGMGRT